MTNDRRARKTDEKKQNEDRPNWKIPPIVSPPSEDYFRNDTRITDENVPPTSREKE